MVYPDFQRPGTSRQATARRDTSLEERVKKTMQDVEKINREENHDRLNVKPTDEEKFEAWLLTGGEKSRFNPLIFLKACRIIRGIRYPQRKVPRPVFISDQERVLTYELAIGILKYSAYLEQALDAAEFFKRFPYYKTIEPEEVSVVVYDLLERNFKTSTDDVELPLRYRSIQRDVLLVRNKVMAHIQSLLTKVDAETIVGLLPGKIRHQHNTDRTPLYAWVNLIKTTIKSMTETLKELNFNQVEFEDDILIHENSFYVDNNHPPLIRFHSSCNEVLSNSAAVKSFRLIIQDKSSCLHAYALVKSLYYREHINRGRKEFGGAIDISLLNEYFANKERSPDTSAKKEPWYDDILETPGTNTPEENCVVVTHCGTGRSAAYLAVLLQTAVPIWLLKNNEVEKPDNDLVLAKRPPLNVVVFGVPEDRMSETYFFFRRDIGAKNVTMYPDNFSDLEPHDVKMKGALAILVNPPSSGSALKDPVNYICSEGGDESILLDMNKFLSNHQKDVLKGNDHPLPYRSSNQAKFLKQALRHPTAKLIMYTTCSLFKSENGEVVSNSLSVVRKELEDEKSRQISVLLPGMTIKSFKDISYTFVNLIEILPSYPKDAFNGPNLELLPSSASSGAYISLIRRREDLITLTSTKRIAKPGPSPTFSTISSSSGRSSVLAPSSISSASASTTMSQQSPDKSKASILDIDMTEFMAKQAATIEFIDNMYTQEDSIFEQLKGIGVLKPPPSESSESPASSSKSEVNELLGKLFDREKQKGKASTSSSRKKLNLPTKKESKKQKKTEKKARKVVERLVLPTHSSLAKHRDKWVNVDAEKDNKFKNMYEPETRREIIKSIANQHHHHHQHPTDCVCPRHAKKFPDFKP